MKAHATRLFLATVTLSGMLVVLTSEPASAADCTGSADLFAVHETCKYSADEARDFFASGDGHVYGVTPACAIGGNATCAQQDHCFDPDGTEKVWYVIFRDGEEIGRTCLADNEAASLGQITPGLVRREFERLTWQSSELAVQPPDGVTLVGFESNFFTTNTGPTAQAVTLLGRRIQIEATPTSYVWHFGDESTETTSTPGAAYPQLLVTHRYQHIGKVQPSVDTVYAGRYRVGTGPWRAIPGTLTVTGQQQELEVREARGVLVGH